MNNKKLQVFYKNQIVGTLALTSERKIAFEYDDSWLENGFSINPFSLPLKKQVFFPSKNHFQGLFGVFADSLPDAWGKILLNRILRKNKISVDNITVLDRLAIVGETGMGALAYRPEIRLDTKESDFNLDDKISCPCRQNRCREDGIRLCKMCWEMWDTNDRNKTFPISKL